MKIPPIILDGFDIGYATMTEAIGKSTYHFHTGYELFFLVSGKNNILIGDKTYAISNGHLAIIPPNTFHQGTYQTNEIERYVINFEEQIIPDIFRSKLKLLHKEPIYIPADPVYLRGLFASVIKEYHREDSLSAEMIRLILCNILAYILRNKSAVRSKMTEITHPHVSKLIKYINTNFSKDITMASAAHELNMSRTYLSRLFKNNTGFSFKEYLNIVRCHQAKELLAGTSMPITKIAYACGFNDSNYFSSAFKKTEGITPSAYRHEPV